MEEIILIDPIDCLQKAATIAGKFIRETDQGQVVLETSEIIPEQMEVLSFNIDKLPAPNRVNLS